MPKIRQNEFKIVQHNRCPEMVMDWFEIWTGRFSEWTKSFLLISARNKAASVSRKEGEVAPHGRSMMS